MGFNPVSVVIVECNKDNSYPGETLLQNPGHFYPTHSGQTDISDHEIGRFFLHFHQCFLRRIRLSDDADKIKLGKQSPEKFAEGSVVIENNCIEHFFSHGTIIPEQGNL